MLQVEDSVVESAGDETVFGKEKKKKDKGRAEENKRKNVTCTFFIPILAI